MKKDSQKSSLRFWFGTAGVALVLLASFPQSAEAQSNTFPSTGNVGVGTTSPGYDLHVKRNAAAGVVSATIENGDSGNPDSSAALNVISKNSTAATQYTRSWLNLVSGHGAIGSVDDGDSASAITFRTNSGQINPTTQAFTLGTRPWTSSLEFHSDATNHILVLKRNGNIGIGTPTPNAQYKLDVNGTINATGIFVNGSPISGGGGGVSSAANVSAGQFGANTGGGDFSFPANVIQENAKVQQAKNAAGVVETWMWPRWSDNVMYTNFGSAGWNIRNNSSTNVMFLTNGGSVGIGTTTPTTKLHVVGDGTITGNLNASGTITGGTINAKYQDVAEWVESSQDLAAGTVVVLDQTRSNHVIASSQAYDTRVAGVISLQPGIALGESGAGKVLVATTGRVRIKVDATAGPIQIGDLLVTGDKEGVAKKSKPLSLGGVAIHRPGTLIGKALEPLENGEGTILVLLSLQ